MVEKFNALIEILKAEWVYILLVIGALLLILRASANAIVNWAKATPDPTDDIKAEEEAKKINVIIQFFKDLFKIKDE